jgi:hypothetical protein
MMTDKSPVPSKKQEKKSHFDVQLLDSHLFKNTERRLSITFKELPE